MVLVVRPGDQRRPEIVFGVDPVRQRTQRRSSCSIQGVEICHSQ